MKSILVFIFIGVFLFTNTAQAQIAGISFGGRVTTIQPCNTGILAYLATTKGPLPVMWFWGNLRYSSFIPPHPGQLMLGKMGPTPIPCISGIIPSGAGFPILFHGSSK